MAEVTLPFYIPASKNNDSMSNVRQLRAYGYLSSICPNSQIIIIQKWALVASFTVDMKTACTVGIIGILQVLTNLLK